MHKSSSYAQREIAREIEREQRERQPTDCYETSLTNYSVHSFKVIGNMRLSVCACTRMYAYVSCPCPSVLVNECMHMCPVLVRLSL